jgi:hypothetical protein
MTEKLGAAKKSNPKKTGNCIALQEPLVSGPKTSEELRVSQIMGMLWHCFDNGKYINIVGFTCHDGRIDDRCLALLAADYLAIKRDIGFRAAHGIAARLSTYLEEKDKMFYELTLEEYNQFPYKGNSHLFDEDIFRVMKLYNSVKLSSHELEWKDLLAA